MVDYVENLNRITGVQWAGARYRVLILNPFFGQPGAVDGNMFIFPQPIDREVVDGEFQQKFVGVDSGAVLDFSQIPVTGASVQSGPAIVACLSTWSNVHDIDGNLLSGSTPFTGYNVTTGAAGILTRQSFTYNAIDVACDGDGNAPNWPISPMFQFGEEVEIFEV